MPAFRSADELPHRGTMTVNEAALATGLSPIYLRQLIRKKEIGAFERVWRYGVYQRRAFFIPIAEMKRWMLAKTAKAVLGAGHVRWMAPKEKKI